jgi:hypothetical protein
MGPRKGQILRLIGLAIEVPCVLALFSYKQGKFGDWSESKVSLEQILVVGVGIGFLFWFAGAIRGWMSPRARPEGR